MSQATAAAPAPTPKPAATPAPVPGVTPAPTARPAEGTDLAAARGIPSALTRWRLIAALGVLAFTALTTGIFLSVPVAGRLCDRYGAALVGTVSRAVGGWLPPGGTL